MPDPAIQLSPSGLTVANPAWSALPDLIHGTTTREALPEQGKSDFFESLARARARAALPDMWTVGADQVHATRVQILDRPLRPHEQPDGYRHDDSLRAGEFPATDALVTTLPGLLLVVQTADCLPVFLLDRQRKVCGLAHGGWRGLLGGIAGRLARAMIDLGAAPSGLEAWLGPAIGAAQYEVGGELVAQFRAAFSGAPVAPDDRHLDLAAVARHQLVAAGVAPVRILSSGECTRARDDRYHSYRAQGEAAGRMLSFIGFRAADDTAEP
jgi:hypothetical protein